jgi:hypothetical protein
MKNVVLHNNVTYLNFHTDFIYSWGEFSEPNFTFNLLLLPDEKLCTLLPTHETSVAGDVTYVSNS